MKTFYAVLVLAVIALKCEAKIYGKCEFATTLLEANFPKDEIGTWSCIAEHESQYNSTLRSDSGSFGIFQINRNLWCLEGDYPGNGCKITCESLLEEDISVDLSCAKKMFNKIQIFKDSGFEAWSSYAKCKGDQSGYVSRCF